jgi:hypothetical protein
MKRHPALHRLSHDHHHGLVMALRLKKGGPASPNDNWPLDRVQQVESLLRFAKYELLPHFELEEQHLLGFATDENRAERIRSDHRELRQLMEKIELAPNDLILQEFGQKLEAHIRFEEREFFPHLQVVLGEEGLQALAHKLSYGR